MNALAATTQAPPAPAQATPQLRTLLLTDLVDSTGTVERLGDAPSAELFRAHDRLVLELQQRWRGRLIDRSDGLLLLFERAVDGLGFALDYNRGLRELGKAHGVPLQARAGLHVGEVLTWRNSAEAVAVGAKPLEVEGLAKPLAGRLLGLARPGQILLSATAEALAHRAARELGERGAQLAWKSHGRWRFKGLPEPLEVYEAGEPGLAPLQTPRPDAKAWRDIPAWRRPAALAAELALAAVVAIGIWFFTRPQPAIAFAERDWVVVADMRNLTGQPVLDESLQQAFRISLEQSRHVNVLSDLKARDTLARMQRQPGTALDRTVASEIAMRDGARAVILPTVAEVGGRVRVSAEVIDPQSQTTVYAEYADGSGLDSVLASVDTVTAALRARLGEEIKAIERDSEPLPQVTTSNLDALRAYALGQESFNASRYDDARGFFARAVELDPGFALAHVGLMRVANAQGNEGAGLAHLRAAQKLRSQLPARDQLYLDAWVIRVDRPREELNSWKRMASLYPDDFRAVMNVAYALFGENRFEEGIAFARRAAVPQNLSQAQSTRLLADYLLALNDFSAAHKAYESAMSSGISVAPIRKATAFAAERKFAEAARLWEEIDVEAGDGVLFDRVALLLDRGRWNEARALAEDLASYPTSGGPRSRAALMPVLTTQYILGDREAARATLRRLVAETVKAMEAPTSANDAVGDAYVLVIAGLMAYRLGEHAIGESVLKSARLRRERFVPPTEALLEVLVATKHRIEGNHDEALRILQELTRQDGAPYAAHVALLDAYISAEDMRSARAQARRLDQSRGFAYIEQGCGWCQQSINVFDTSFSHLKLAEVLAKQRRKAEARTQITELDAKWPDLPRHLRARRALVEAEIE